MIAARQDFTATLLRDGRVLLAGGSTEKFGELYDPKTRKFTRTGKMRWQRSGHTATLLSDSRVLVTGGCSFNCPAEIYDPKTGEFQATGRMSVARSDQTAVLLKNGHVLVAGGWQSDAGEDYMLNTAELYDPASGTFARTGNMTAVSAVDTGISLGGNRVLLIGGRQYWGGAIPQIYDAVSGRFAQAGNRLSGYACKATLLENGAVLITGCVQGLEVATAEARLYDPGTHRLIHLGDTTLARVGSSATLLRDGRVLIAGGQARRRSEAMEPAFLASAELYDPRRRKFTPTGRMNVRRRDHEAVRLLDGQVLILGGTVVVPVTSLPRPETASAESCEPGPSGRRSLKLTAWDGTAETVALGKASAMPSSAIQK